MCISNNVWSLDVYEKRIISLQTPHTPKIRENLDEKTKKQKRTTASDKLFQEFLSLPGMCVSCKCFKQCNEDFPHHGKKNAGT